MVLATLINRVREGPGVGGKGFGISEIRWKCPCCYASCFQHFLLVVTFKEGAEDGAGTDREVSITAALGAHSFRQFVLGGPLEWFQLSLQPESLRPRCAPLLSDGGQPPVQQRMFRIADCIVQTASRPQVQPRKLSFPAWNNVALSPLDGRNCIQFSIVIPGIREGVSAGSITTVSAVQPRMTDGTLCPSSHVLLNC